MFVVVDSFPFIFSLCFIWHCYSTPKEEWLSCIDQDPNHVTAESGLTCHVLPLLALWRKKGSLFLLKLENQLIDFEVYFHGPMLVFDKQCKESQWNKTYFLFWYMVVDLVAPEGLISLQKIRKPWTPSILSEADLVGGLEREWTVPKSLVGCL